MTKNNFECFIIQMGNQVKHNQNNPTCAENIDNHHSQVQSQVEYEDSEDYNDEIALRSEKLQLVTQEQIGNRLHRFIGALYFRYNNSPHIGNATGVLISPNLVLTCAHSLFSHSQYLQPAVIDFYPAQYGPLRKSYKVEQYFFPEEFKKKNVPKFDYALLKLQQEVNLADLPRSANQPNAGQFIKLRDTFLSADLEEQLALFGYPLTSYKQSGILAASEESYQMGLRHKGDAKVHFKKGKLEHYISTQMGQSGSPVISINRYKGRQIITICAIHKAGKNKNHKPSPKKQGKQHKQNEYNVACLITAEVVKVLERQALKMQAKMFDKVRPTVVFKNAAVPQYWNELNYWQIRGRTCQRIARDYLKLSEQKSKTICFLSKGKLYKPGKSFILSPQTEAFLSYHDDLQVVEVQILFQKDLFYREMEAISENPQSEQLLLQYLHPDLTAQRMAKISQIAHKCTIEYFKQLNHLVPVFCFTDKLHHREYTQFLNNLTSPFASTHPSHRMFLAMTALLIKHAQKLPVFRGTCYHLVNYKDADYKIGEEITFKNFLHCITKKQLSQAVLSQLERQSCLLQIESYSSRIFYQVSSFPSQNQVTFLPFSVFRVTGHRDELIQSRKIKVFLLQQTHIWLQNKPAT